jgi:hypothetical protein
MNDTPQQQPDPAEQRRWAIFDEVRRILHATLPPPLADTPEAWALRDSAALAAVVSLAPVNMAEAALAAHHVVAMDHASDCLRLAAQHAADPEVAGRLRDQAASMGRVARGYQSMLLKVQAVRRKRQANPVTRESDARTEQYVLRQMTEALESIMAAEKPPAVAESMMAAEKPPAAAPEPDRPGPARQRDRPMNLRLWQAHLHAGPPKPIDKTIH